MNNVEMNVGSLKDLCLVSTIKSGTLKERSLIPADLLQDIDRFSSSVKEKDISFIFSEGRIGLCPLIDKSYVGLQCASFYGYQRAVEYFITTGNLSDGCLELGLHHAALGGHLPLVKFFISKGANDWYGGMVYAAQGGYRDLVELFLKELGERLGTYVLNSGMSWVAYGGHMDLVELFITKGANDWNGGMVKAAHGGHMDLVKFFISKGADSWNWGMANAVQGNHLSLIELFISKGANDWNLGMEGARLTNNQALMDFFRSKLVEREEWLE